MHILNLKTLSLRCTPQDTSRASLIPEVYCLPSCPRKPMYWPSRPGALNAAKLARGSTKQMCYVHVLQIPACEPARLPVQGRVAAATTACETGNNLRGSCGRPLPQPVCKSVGEGAVTVRHRAANGSCGGPRVHGRGGTAFCVAAPACTLVLRRPHLNATAAYAAGRWPRRRAQILSHQFMRLRVVHVQIRCCHKMCVR